MVVLGIRWWCGGQWGLGEGGGVAGKDDIRIITRV